MAIVYVHRRKDIDDQFKNVFYVGIGSSKIRPYQNTGRNKRWHHIVKKCGYTTEITHTNLIREEACSIEKYLISFYGRADLFLGNLCNVTDGGELNLNRKKDVEWIEKHRLTQIGKKRTAEVKEKISIRTSGVKNPFYGKKHSIENRLKMSKKASERPINIKNIEKMRTINIGRKMKDESKLKLSNARKGIQFTKEHREKLSIARLAYLNKKRQDEKEISTDNSTH